MSKIKRWWQYGSIRSSRPSLPKKTRTHVPKELRENSRNQLIAKSPSKHLTKAKLSEWLEFHGTFACPCPSHSWCHVPWSGESCWVPQDRTKRVEFACNVLVWSLRIAQGISSVSHDLQCCWHSLVIKCWKIWWVLLLGENCRRPADLPSTKVWAITAKEYNRSPKHS
jgi:hypothetical protein